MTLKHSPGPWQYRPDKYDDWGTVRSATGELVAAAKDSTIPFAALGEYRERNEDPYEANARLISAAPEMLEALKAAVKQLEAIGFDGLASGADAAIAKAEGRYPLP